jgi:hypothetical protein
MATRGFEWAYNLDGSSDPPVTRDFVLSTAAKHVPGDLMTIEASDGDVTQVTNSTKEVTGVCQELVAAAAITAGTTKAKLAIITRNQVWRCSTDASTAATAIPGSVKTWDTADCNTIDADDVTNGSMIVVDTSTLDDDGYVLGYVVFADTTFGNL